jgi:hypothetical protein
MEDYPGLSEALALTPWPLLGLKTPSEMRQLGPAQGKSHFGNIDRPSRLGWLLGANPNAGFEIRKIGTRQKCLGRYGTIIYLTSGFATGYAAGASLYCIVIVCNPE